VKKAALLGWLFFVYDVTGTHFTGMYIGPYEQRRECQEVAQTIQTWESYIYVDVGECTHEDTLKVRHERLRLIEPLRKRWKEAQHANPWGETAPR
jgi:hypothetical protein